MLFGGFVGSQTRLTRCFAWTRNCELWAARGRRRQPDTTHEVVLRGPEVASQQQTQNARSETWFDWPEPTVVP